MSKRKAEARPTAVTHPAVPPKRPVAPRRAAWVAAVAAIGVLGVLGIVLARRTPAPPPAAAPAAAPALPGVGSMTPAEQSLREELARLPEDPEAHRALGRYLLDQGRPFEALWHWRLVADLNPGDTDSEVGVAQALLGAGLPARAAALLRARLARSPEDGPARLALAETALSTARPQEALAALRAGGPVVTTSAAGQLLLGDARFCLGDLAGARAAYERAAQLEPESAAGYERQGRVALERREWEAAKQAFAAAREREPGTPGHGFRLGLAYQGAGETEEAERLWAELAAAAPEYAPARLAVGNALRRHKQWDAAAPHLVAAVNLDPASREAQLALAEVMTAQGDRASAAYQRGLYYLQSDRPHQAVEEFRRIQTLAPDRVDGPRMTAMAHIVMKRLDLAAAEVQRGLKRHPNDARLLGQLGLLYVLGRNRPQARQLCEAWLKRDPQAAEAHRLLGRVAREELRLPEAQLHCDAALARNVEDAVIHHEAAKTYTALSGPENARRALELAQRAVELNPKEADHWLQLGTLLRGAGRQEEATEVFLRTLDRNPAEVAACTALVQIAAQQRRAETSRFYAGLVTELQDRSRTGDPLWRAVYRRPGDPAAHERLGRFLLAGGDLEHAGNRLEQVVELRPADSASRRDLAVIRRLLSLRAE